MATFRRAQTPGATYFFTLATYRRQRILTQASAIHALRAALRSVRTAHPFEIVAWVVLPDHMHAIWTLPPDDADYSRRWALIKRSVSKSTRALVRVPLADSLRARHESGFWQRRFWEHQIRDEADLRRHVNYIHYNPVKHGYVKRPIDWPHSTLH